MVNFFRVFCAKVTPTRLPSVNVVIFECSHDKCFTKVIAFSGWDVSQEASCVSHYATQLLPKLGSLHAMKSGRCL